jgi:hypothetical protein
VAAGPALHVGDIAAGRHHVADVEDVERARRPDSDVVQARPAAVGESEVVDVALAVQPHRPKLGIGVVGLGVFGELEADVGVEVVARLHVRREAVEMVDALNAGALIGGVFLQHALGLLHAEAKIQRHAEDIRGAQRAALVRQLRERDREILAAEPEGGAVQVLLARHLEAERVSRRLARLAQHDRMMIALLDRPQIDGVRGFNRRQQPEAVDVESARSREVAHAQLDVAGTHDIERRIGRRLADGHASPWTGHLIGFGLIVADPGLASMWQTEVRAASRAGSGRRCGARRRAQVRRVPGART